jgi:hypothetical protein
MRLIALNLPPEQFEPSAKLYLYRLLKILKAKSISPKSTLLLNTKTKVLIQFIQSLRSNSSRFIKRSKFLFSYEVKNSDLFLSKANKFIKKIVDFKKVVVDVVDKSAKFRPYKPPTARNEW